MKRRELLSAGTTALAAAALRLPSVHADNPELARDRDRSIEWCEYARAVHKSIIARIRVTPDWNAQEMGDEAWHKMWVRRYNVILRVLRAIP